MGISEMTDHDKIREWIEARGGHPARMKSGIVGVEFGGAESPLENISWDEFFKILDESRDVFLRHDCQITRH